MASEAGRQVRWPGWAMVVLFLGYGLGKAVFAAQGKLGFPGGPVVPAAEYESYARDVMDVAAAQWLAASNGLLGAAVFLATVVSVGRRIPRPLMLVALALTSVGVGAGMVVLIVDGFLGLGVGWRWYHGLLGVVVLGLQTAAFWSYARAPRCAARSSAIRLSSRVGRSRGAVRDAAHAAPGVPGRSPRRHC
ncbi:hypothetical protein [Streptomyces smyrnaeus]|uniref:hypothetical protein n=1 Tax=Streptomyces smyrnaeus TaxID=1387713 RepID=UPI0033E38F15